MAQVREGKQDKSKEARTFKSKNDTNYSHYSAANVFH